jgi:hypothetical protein
MTPEELEKQADALAQDLAAQQAKIMEARADEIYKKLQQFMEDNHCTLRVEMIPQIIVIPLPPDQVIDIPIPATPDQVGLPE